MSSRAKGKVLGAAFPWLISGEGHLQSRSTMPFVEVTFFFFFLLEFWLVNVLLPTAIIFPSPDEILSNSEIGLQMKEVPLAVHLPAIRCC